MEHNWNGRPYHSLDWELKHTFGHKVYKLSLDAGLTCPNRDGTLGTRGCIFCSEGGSGDFAEILQTDVWDQIEAAKKRVSNKTGSDKNINYILGNTGFKPPSITGDVNKQFAIQLFFKLFIEFYSFCIHNNSFKTD